MSSGKSRFIIGSKNKKYGLIKRNELKAGSKSQKSMGFGGFGLKKAAAAGRKRGRVPAAAPVLDVFAKGAAEEGEAPVLDTKDLAMRHKRARQEKVRRGCERRRMHLPNAAAPLTPVPRARASQIAKQHEEALAHDASIFDYDAWASKEGRHHGKLGRTAGRDADAKAAGAGEAKKSKYIEAMRATSRRRQVISDRVYERKLQKEREEDEDLYADKEKFITSGYREKLEADKKLAAAEAAAAAKEADVTQQKGLGGFYRNLLNNNVAFGGGRASHAGKAAVVEVEAPAEAAAGEGPAAAAAAGAGSGEGAGAGAGTPAPKRVGFVEPADAAGAGGGAPVQDEVSAEDAAAAAAKAKLEAKRKREAKMKAAREKFLARKAARAAAAKKAAAAGGDE